MPATSEMIRVDGALCTVAARGSSEKRCIVALEPGIFALAVQLDDQTWTAQTGEPADDGERAALKRLVDATPDTLTVAPG